MSTPPTPSPMPSRHRLRRALAAAAVSVMLVSIVAGCADFSSEASTFTVQPSLTAPAAQPVDPSSAQPSSPSPSSGDQSPSPDPSGSQAPNDPCAPTDESVIATCLTAPWGLAPLPAGQSALVGERTTGRILQVAKGQQPVEVAKIDGIDASGDGGLLGIALSPSYDEDGLIYAYVTTAEDNRIIRIASGDVPKPVFTGIPRGATHNGGRLTFASDRTLYVGTGDTANPALPADPTSLAGKVLRLDEFGKPAEGNPTAASPIFASGFTEVNGLCTLEDGTVAALDQRSTQDVLLPLTAGHDYTALAPGDARWTWTSADGRAADCAISGGLLASTSLDKQQLTGIQMSAGGTFTGTPTAILDNRYGRLLTVTADTQGLLWLTTSNKDGSGTPVPSDDRVVVVPASDAGGAGGPD